MRYIGFIILLSKFYLELSEHVTSRAASNVPVWRQIVTLFQGHLFGLTRVSKLVERLERDKFVTIPRPCAGAFLITPISSARRCPRAPPWCWGRSSLSKHCLASQHRIVNPNFKQNTSTVTRRALAPLGRTDWEINSPISFHSWFSAASRGNLDGGGVDSIKWTSVLQQQRPYARARFLSVLLRIRLFSLHNLLYT